jgi:ABC-type amino acid transport substrate-binding protein
MSIRWAGALLLWAALLPAAAAPAASSEIVVRYPRPESGDDARSRHPLHLLELVLQRSGRPYRIELNPVRMQQGRALLQLENNDGIDVVSTMTSIEREARLHAVRIPIDKGLIGWRLLLINRSRVAEFEKVRTLDDLKGLTAGQGLDWPDTPILRANGLNVYGTSSYDSLFSMLESGRIDYFPRSVSEVWSELALNQEKLMVEPSVVLHYPTAIYFFVRKGDTQLAADITSGMEKMLADGSFDKLFQEYYGDMIRRSALKERRVFELRNPLAPASLPLSRKGLWFRE